MNPTLLFYWLSVMLSGFNPAKPPETRPPSIVLILADDLGWGDVSCLNPAAKTQTPALNRLARQGMLFTDAHSPSSVCTPTRYGLLTGRYAWRSRLKKGVLQGYSPPLLEPGRETLASLLKKRGYTTACIGKWHLGLNWQPLNAQKPLFFGKEGDPDSVNVDFSRPVTGVREAGFDESFLISASLDMQPYCFIQNGNVLGQPLRSYAGAPQAIEGRNKGSFHRKGVIANGFSVEDVLPTFVRQAEAFIEHQQKAPFFLYLPLNSPHTPWVPSGDFNGKTAVGAYGDFVRQTDWAVGRITDLLDRLKLADNTLVIFTSDNGAYWFPEDIRRYGHRANADWRGCKADIHEAGHRVPFLVRWPGKIKPATRSDALFCLTDVVATLADVVGVSLTTQMGEDSFSFWPVWQGKATPKPIRETVVHHAIDSLFALRRGDWKLIWGPGSGGFTQPARPPVGPGEPFGQLYNLRFDPAETRNQWTAQPALVRQLHSLLEACKQGKSSRVEATVKNQK